MTADRRRPEGVGKPPRGRLALGAAGLDAVWPLAIKGIMNLLGSTGDRAAVIGRINRYGWFILIVLLVKDERPLLFFSAAGAALLLAGFGLGVPVVLEFLRTRLVLRLPTAILAAALVGLSFLSFASALILDTVARGRQEAKRLAYLAVPGP